MANVNFDHLFSPLQVGPMKVPNRICETTNTINSSMAPGLIPTGSPIGHASDSGDPAADELYASVFGKES